MKKMIIDINSLVIWLHKHSQQLLCAGVIFPIFSLLICSMNTIYESIRITDASSVLLQPVVNKMRVDLNMDEGSHVESTGTVRTAPTAGAPTSLALTLTGIITSDERQSSQAIIVSRGVTGNYNQGENIEGLPGVFIEKIDANTVNINNNGSSQIMTLLDEAPSLPGKLPQSVGNARFLSDFIIGNPVYENDKLTGVRLYPRGAINRFSKMGFKPGDIALKINNHILSDPAGMKVALNELGTLSSAQFTVLRNSNEKLINASTMDVE
ncbi:type II secretion system protein N [Scandinavium goeteborgense]|uniref:Type II secretion system protein C n=1 Tax=Scandinavium goeteborgense TaxID=1851514 RepID=A0A4R6DW55_SCAGO|nr:type II secretion system protein N [Scandinavium goeteborgense]TDN48568.1 type II secretion system protein C [Scandinavium goeteborgense]